MKYFLILAVINILTGCATVPRNAKAIQALSYGVWSGEFETITTKPFIDAQPDDKYFVMVSACSPKLEFYIKLNDYEFQKIYSDYKVDSKSGSTVYSLIEDGGDWIEIQVWSIVSIDENKAAIQWSRMVSNINNPSTDEFRSFGELGYGNLTKINNGCDLFKSE